MNEAMEESDSTLVDRHRGHVAGNFAAPYNKKVNEIFVPQCGSFRQRVELAQGQGKRPRKSQAPEEQILRIPTDRRSSEFLGAAVVLVRRDDNAPEARDVGQDKAHDGVAEEQNLAQAIHRQSFERIH